LKLVFENLKFSSDNRTIIDDVSITVNEGITGFYGKNGAGKTVLTMLIAGLLKSTSGTIRIEPKDISPVTGFAFEIPDDSLFLDTVYDEVAFGIKNYKLPIERVAKVIEFFGLKPEISPQKLSFSEKKLLTLASLSYDPEVVVVDEPFRGLDSEKVKKVCQFLKRLGEKANILITFSNDLETLKAFCQRIGVIEGGKLFFK
jgi:cobalt/nickel transport system ATP-binding protein